MEAKAVSRYARMSSLKVMKVSGAVKGKPVETALAILKFLPQKAAKQLEKLIRSAVANVGQGPLTLNGRRSRGQRLMDVTERALYAGIAQAVPGNRVTDISRAIQEVVGRQFSRRRLEVAS